jgi:hypothetical protein
MLDYQQEKKLEMILSLIDLPEQKEQPRDDQGRFSEQNPKKSKSDLDDVIWVDCGNGTFVRRRKMRYVIYDVSIIVFIFGVVALVL